MLLVYVLCLVYDWPFLHCVCLYFYSPGLLTKAPSEALREIARMTPTGDSYKGFDSFFMVGVQPTEQEDRTLTPTKHKEKEDKIKVSFQCKNTATKLCTVKLQCVRLKTGGFNSRPVLLSGRCNSGISLFESCYYNMCVLLSATFSYWNTFYTLNSLIQTINLTPNKWNVLLTEDFFQTHLRKMFSWKALNKDYNIEPMNKLEPVY